MENADSEACTILSPAPMAGRAGHKAFIHSFCGWAFYLLCALVVASLLAGCGPKPEFSRSGPIAEWPAYGGDPGGMKYSPLDQVRPENVNDLEVAWIYHHGDFSDGEGEFARTSFQATPLVVDGTIYFCTAFARVIALEAATGREKWTFDPDLKARRGEGPYPLTCRGVAYWSGPETAGSESLTCKARILTGTRDSELIALDAATGRPCSDFGVDGRVSLREGMGSAEPWEYYPTSPPVVVGEVVVVGALVADQLRVDAPSGVVRAFDVVTGELKWAWDPVPPNWKPNPARPAGKGRYQAGTPNVWAPMSVDTQRGLVFVPTGNPATDSYAAGRHGLDYFGSSVVALDAKTGVRIWHFQTVHHDVWDYDVASQPALFQSAQVGGGRPAVAQATKMGHIFLLDRETGDPLYPVEERSVPQGGAVPGESLSRTQPFPTHPPPLQPGQITAETAWGFTPFDRSDCRERIKGLRSEGIFTPPSLQGSIQFPGSAGGANWGGVAIDPVRDRLYVNQNRMPMVVRLIPRNEFAGLDPGSVVYPDELYPARGTPYAVQRGSLLSAFGAPCIAPPWGTLTSVDLRTGEVLWEVPLGTTRDQAPFPLWFSFGAPNLGGPIATASGLVIIGATTDRYIRAFEAETGEEIWRARLPFTANATPVTYRLDSSGRQFVVISSGGHGWSEPGDALVAFALPEPRRSLSD
ncbi:MAG: pyrroloquinoline quinone-dependent dehydrogenase [Myxococcota bacterium]|nr:pyrroloquinoline quinone-dependent dehydrogenase [Myxococcota bacterium]